MAVVKNHSIVSKLYSIFLKINFIEFLHNSEVLGWGIFINFQIYITLPIPLLWEGVALGLVNAVVFMTLNICMCINIKGKYKNEVCIDLLSKVFLNLASVSIFRQYLPI